ncbi:MAG: hypothetical protein U0136_10395 [Bdellovibrionota bacterium]
MFENKNDVLLSRTAFLKRMGRYFLSASGIVFAALTLGAIGYRVFEGLPWIDSFLNASMLLGGMGPVNALQTTGGKLFAIFYALFSGLVFLVVMGLVLAPVIHRMLHRFHLTLEDDDAKNGGDDT